MLQISFIFSRKMKKSLKKSRNYRIQNPINQSNTPRKYLQEYAIRFQFRYFPYFSGISETPELFRRNYSVFFRDFSKILKFAIDPKIPTNLHRFYSILLKILEKSSKNREKLPNSKKNPSICGNIKKPTKLRRFGRKSRKTTKLRRFREFFEKKFANLPIFRKFSKISRFFRKFFAKILKNLKKTGKKKKKNKFLTASTSATKTSKKLELDSNIIYNSLLYIVEGGYTLLS